MRERTFKKADLQRAIIVAREADFLIRQIEITKQGRIILVPGKPSEETATDAAAAQLGISRRQVAYYADQRAIPRYIALACRYLDLELAPKPNAALETTVETAEIEDQLRVREDVRAALWQIGRALRQTSQEPVSASLTTAPRRSPR